MVLCGNCCDISNSEREVKTGEGERLAVEEWDVPFFEVSAKDEISNIEIFHELVRQIRNSKLNTDNGIIKEKKKGRFGAFFVSIYCKWNKGKRKKLKDNQ